MTRTLIAKELRQHWLPFLLLAGLLGFGLLLTTAGAALRQQGSLLIALRDFLATFVVVGLLVVCNRLVVLEYQSRTQLFLEGLPLTRLRMVTVKFALGLILMTGVVTCAFAFLLLASAQREALTLRFVQIVAARTYAFLLCAYAFFFLMGLLGRYRIPVYLVLILCVMFLASETTLEPNRFGPLALLKDQFGFEREQFPTQALMTSLGVSAVLIGAIVALSLIREGSVAALLAEKMSHREKVFVALLLFAVVAAIGIYDEKVERAPLDLPDAIVESGQGVTVNVATDDVDEQTGRAFAQALHRDLVALQDYLQLPELPPLFVVPRSDLDRGRYERAEVEGATGILVRANFAAADFRQQDFAAWLTRETLIVASHGRAKWEPRMWVLDGFARFWARRRNAEQPATGQPAGQPDQQALRAAYGAECGFSQEDLPRWLLYRDRVGPDIAAAVACSGLEYLARTCGEDRCRDFLQEVLRTDVPSDVRGSWHDWRSPWPKLLEGTCGVTADDFCQQWLDELNASRQALSKSLAAVPRLTGELTSEPLSPLTRKVTYSLTAVPPPASDRFRLLHAELGAFDAEVPASTLQEEDWSYAEARCGDLPQNLTRGSRLYWTFAVACEPLGCDVISGWCRQEVR